MEKKSNLLVGHSSFYLRNGWLKKGIEYVQEDNHESIFSKSNIKAIDRLGIGSVMVQSLKFWLVLLDILGKSKREFYLKRDIVKILEKDPYLQNASVLWLLHTYIMERENKNEKPVLWDLVLKDKKQRAFTEKEIYKKLISYYKENEEVLSERSAKDSVGVFIKTYFKESNSFVDPEDNLVSPFVGLNYLRKNENEEYYFRDIEHFEIAEEVILYLIKKQMKNIENNQVTILDSYDFITGIIKMKINDFEKIIQKLENRNFLSIDRAAGLQNINIKKEIQEEELIDLILERE